MSNKIISGNSFADVYSKAINILYNDFEFETSPRNLKIRECLNANLVISDPTKNLWKCSDKKLTMPTAYTKKEICLYLNGYNLADLFSKASPFWDQIKNSDNTINSAYGNLIFNPSLSDNLSQFEWAYYSLSKDKDSRQAFMRYNNNQHQIFGNKDLPCTFIQIFHIRENKLHSTVIMRSNDVCSGTIHDIPSFTLFQYLMYLRLKESDYPDLELGEYVHIANSFHLYEKDFEITKNRIDVGLEENSFPLPKNWRVIKSYDIEAIIQKKFYGVEIDESKWVYPENKEFYNWLLS